MAKSSWFVASALVVCFVCSACSDQSERGEGVATVIQAIRTTVDSNGDIRIDGQVIERQDVRDHFERLHEEYPDRPVEPMSAELFTDEYRFVLEAAWQSGFSIAISASQEIE
jgi:Fe-S oxidoreductase